MGVYEAGATARIVYESRQNGSVQTVAGTVARPEPESGEQLIETPDGKTYLVDTEAWEVYSVTGSYTTHIGELLHQWTGDEPLVLMSEHQLRRMRQHLRKADRRMRSARGYFPEGYDPGDHIGEYGFAHDFTTVEPILDGTIHDIVGELERRREAGL